MAKDENHFDVRSLGDMRTEKRDVSEFCCYHPLLAGEQKIDLEKHPALSREDWREWVDQPKHRRRKRRSFAASGKAAPSATRPGCKP